MREDGTHQLGLYVSLVQSVKNTINQINNFLKRKFKIKKCYIISFPVIEFQ